MHTSCSSRWISRSEKVSPTMLRQPLHWMTCGGGGGALSARLRARIRGRPRAACAAAARRTSSCCSACASLSSMLPAPRPRSPRRGARGESQRGGCSEADAKARAPGAPRAALPAAGLARGGHPRHPSLAAHERPREGRRRAAPARRAHGGRRQQAQCRAKSRTTTMRMWATTTTARRASRVARLARRRRRGAGHARLVGRFRCCASPLRAPDAAACVPAAGAPDEAAPHAHDARPAHQVRRAGPDGGAWRGPGAFRRGSAVPSCGWARAAAAAAARRIVTSASRASCCARGVCGSRRAPARGCLAGDQGAPAQAPAKTRRRAACGCANGAHSAVASEGRHGCGRVRRAAPTALRTQPLP